MTLDLWNLIFSNKKESQENIELVKDRLINIGILCIPIILVIIGSILNIIENTVFILLFLLSFVPSIHLFIRLVRYFIQLLKYKSDTEDDMQKEIEKNKKFTY